MKRFSMNIMENKLKWACYIERINNTRRTKINKKINKKKKGRQIPYQIE